MKKSKKYKEIFKLIDSNKIYSPEDAFEVYYKAGYDFIARTDHWHASESGSYKGMLLIPGCEYDVGKVREDGMYHILGIGCPQTSHRVSLSASK